MAWRGCGRRSFETRHPTGRVSELEGSAGVRKRGAGDGAVGGQRTPGTENRGWGVLARGGGNGILGTLGHLNARCGWLFVLRWAYTRSQPDDFVVVLLRRYGEDRKGAREETQRRI